MKRSFSDRLKAAEKALTAHLEARETHIMRHHALKERLKGIQDNSADTEELRTQNALGTLGRAHQTFAVRYAAHKPPACAA